MFGSYSHATCGKMPLFLEPVRLKGPLPCCRRLSIQKTAKMINTAPAATPVAIPATVPCDCCSAVIGADGVGVADVEILEIDDEVRVDIVVGLGVLVIVGGGTCDVNGIGREVC